MNHKKPSFIDIHNHGIWGVDDGIQTKEDSELMLHQAYSDGIKTIITTPHRTPYQTIDHFTNQVRKSIDLKKMAQPFGINIYEGNEIYLDNLYTEIFESKSFKTLGNSSYVLVEFNLQKDISEIPEADAWLYEIIIKGYRPIIAHVERYYKKYINLDQIQYWIKLGCFIQVNRTSILKMNGEINFVHACTLLDQKYVHIVASDAHRVLGNRICKMSDAYEMLYRKYGKENANLLCCENPQRILQNEILQVMKKRPSLINRWRKR